MSHLLAQRLPLLVTQVATFFQLPQIALQPLSLIIELSLKACQQAFMAVLTFEVALIQIPKGIVAIGEGHVIAQLCPHGHLDTFYRIEHQQTKLPIEHIK
ncbi:hypothetical protein D3C87_1549540 [compost metagenome]